MSILDEIRSEAAAGGRLIQLAPLVRGEHSRICYVMRELYDEIRDGDASNSPNQFRIGKLMRDFDRFMSGRRITVGYGEEKTCFMKPLDPRGEEVWEIRSRDPSPALRVYGRFADTDVFVATHKAWRSSLGPRGSVEWGREIRYCKAKWRQVFQAFEPHTGNTINDYIRRNVVEICRMP